MRLLNSWSVPPSSTSASHHDRVPALEQRVQELHHRDGDAVAVAAREVVPLEHPGHGGAGGEAQHVLDAHRAQPLGVAADLEGIVEEDPARLLHVGGGVGLDLLLREPGPGRRPARRVTDLGGEVADDQDRGVTELLELAQLAQHDREAEVDVGRRRVDAELDPQRAAGARACAGGRPR